MYSFIFCIPLFSTNYIISHCLTLQTLYWPLFFKYLLSKHFCKTCIQLYKSVLTPSCWWCTITSGAATPALHAVEEVKVALRCCAGVHYSKSAVSFSPILHPFLPLSRKPWTKRPRQLPIPVWDDCSHPSAHTHIHTHKRICGGLPLMNACRHWAVLLNFASPTIYLLHNCATPLTRFAQTGAVAMVEFRHRARGRAKLYESLWSALLTHAESASEEWQKIKPM